MAKKISKYNLTRFPFCKFEYKRASFCTHPSVRNTPGIYFLLNSYDEIMYIGQGGNCLKRICDHVIENKKKFSQAIYIEIDETMLDLYEALFIIWAKPPYNYAIPNLGSPRIDLQWKKLWLRMYCDYFGITEWEELMDPVQIRERAKQLSNG